MTEQFKVRDKESGAIISWGFPTREAAEAWCKVNDIKMKYHEIVKVGKGE